MVREQLLVFDGYCRVCINLVRLMNVTGLFPAEQCISYYNLVPEVKSLIDEDRFKNEMAFIDPSDGVLYGPHGIKKAVSSKTGLLNLLLRIPFIFSLFIFVYKLIAYNRYVILLPKQAALECDCGPDKERKFRNYYFVLLSVLSMLTVEGAFALAGLSGKWLWLSCLVVPLLYGLVLACYKILYPSTYHFDLRQHSSTSLLYAFAIGLVVECLCSLVFKQIDLLLVFLIVSGTVFFLLYRNRIRFLQFKQTFVYWAVGIMFFLPLMFLLIG